MQRLIAIVLPEPVAILKASRCLDGVVGHLVHELLALVDHRRIGGADYVIVHKVDRLARNRYDDATITYALHRAGVELVSVTENIDDTPFGRFMHAIVAANAEFYSANLAAEARKGLIQKAKAGGTPTRAPLGYLNVRKQIDGREVRTVEVDPERAPHVRWAFAAYASGAYTLDTLQTALTERGLVTRPTPSRPPKPLSALPARLPAPEPLLHRHRALRERRVSQEELRLDDGSPPKLHRGHRAGRAESYSRDRGAARGRAGRIAH